MGRRAVPCAIAFCVLFSSALADARPRGLAPAHRKVNIDLHQADIGNVVRLFSDISGANFVLDDDVKGKVTVRLRQVGWLRALRVILKSRGLEAELDGNIIRVVRRETLAAERKAKLTARQRCLQQGPLRTRFYRPSYADAARLAKVIRGTLTPRGSVMVDQRTNTLIVRDVSCPR